MNILADTHVFLWFILDSPQLSSKARAALVSTENTRSISIASVWEVSIKHSLGKLQLLDGLQEFIKDIERANFDLLGIAPEHILMSGTLPHHHRDPFDRMLIAQAKHEGMHLLTSDPQFAQYDVPLVDL